MKKTTRMLALLCVLMMLVSLAACGDKKDDSAKKSDGGETVTEAPADSNLADYEWVKFEMPEGYADAKESDAYVTIKEEADSHHIIKMFEENIFSKTYDEMMQEFAEDDYYTLGDVFELGGRTWTPVRFTFNDNPSVKLYTPLTETKYFYMTAFEMEETEPAVKTVIESLEIATE